MSLIRSAGSLIATAVVGVVMAGVAAGVSPKEFSVSSLKELLPSGFVASEKFVTDLTPPPAGGLTPTRIRIGVAQPGAAGDQVFVLSLPENTLRQENVSPGFRVSVPSLTQTKPPTVKMEEDQKTTVLEREDGTKQSIKTEKGDPYKDVIVIGMWDVERVAAVARDDQRRLLSIGKDGVIRQVATLEDAMQALFVSGGAAWFVRTNQDPNRPTCPVGPSSLVRIDETGAIATVVSDARIIVTAVDGPSGSIAYAFDSGDMEAHSGSRHWSGKGKPLAWADASHVVLSQGPKLFLLDLIKGSLADAGSLPQVPSLATRVQ